MKPQSLKEKYAEKIKNELIEKDVTSISELKDDEVIELLEGVDEIEEAAFVKPVTIISHDDGVVDDDVLDDITNNELIAQVKKILQAVGGPELIMKYVSDKIKEGKYEFKLKSTVPKTAEEEKDETVDVPAESVADLCSKFRINNWTLGSDGSVDVDGDVDLKGYKLTALPIKFGVIKGSFDCSHNSIMSLVNSPREVRDEFNCSYNKIRNLENCPIKVNTLNCSYNKLRNLKNSPIECESIICHHNNITSLEGAPKEIKGSFDCSHNRLETLNFAPEHVSKLFACDNNVVPFSAKDVKKIVTIGSTGKVVV